MHNAYYVHVRVDPYVPVQAYTLMNNHTLFWFILLILYIVVQILMLIHLPATDWDVRPCRHAPGSCWDIRYVKLFIWCHMYVKSHSARFYCQSIYSRVSLNFCIYDTGTQVQGLLNFDYKLNCLGVYRLELCMMGRLK